MLNQKIDAKNKELREALRAITPTTTQIDVVKTQVIDILRNVKTDEIQKIGYVSGVISSDGPKHIPKNIAVLDTYTEFYRMTIPFPAFSSSDIFYGKYTERFNLSQSEWLTFWSSILKSGTITDVFMTPRWKISNGAVEEHKMAKELNLTIHNHENKVDLRRILINSRRDLEMSLY